MSSIEIGSLHLVHSLRSRHSFDIYLSNLIFLLIFSTYSVIQYCNFLVVINCQHAAAALSTINTMYYL